MIHVEILLTPHHHLSSHHFRDNTCVQDTVIMDCYGNSEIDFSQLFLQTWHKVFPAMIRNFISPGLRILLRDVCFGLSAMGNNFTMPLLIFLQRHFTLGIFCYFILFNYSELCILLNLISHLCDDTALLQLLSWLNTFIFLFLQAYFHDGLREPLNLETIGHLI